MVVANNSSVLIEAKLRDIQTTYDCAKTILLGYIWFEINELIFKFDPKIIVDVMQQRYDLQNVNVPKRHLLKNLLEKLSNVN